jgi:hypothetical protein
MERLRQMGCRSSGCLRKLNEKRGREVCLEDWDPGLLGLVLVVPFSLGRISGPGTDWVHRHDQVQENLDESLGQGDSKNTWLSWPYYFTDLMYIPLHGCVPYLVRDHRLRPTVNTRQECIPGGDLLRSNGYRRCRESFGPSRSECWFNVIGVSDRFPTVRFVEQHDVAPRPPNVDSECSKSSVWVDDLQGSEMLKYFLLAAEFLPGRGSTDQGTPQASTP